MRETPLQNDAGLDEIIAGFLEAEEVGRPVSPEQVIAEHPEFADALRNFFADRDLLRSAARPLADAVVARRPVLGKIRYFGDYELLEEIARGGMGVVYKARQTSLNRIVAVKMILAGNLASEVDVHRFQIEAEAAARLQHPNIVAVHEVGRQDGHSYFSMDYVDGRNLSEIIREDPVPMRQAAKYVAEIADAVHYAHQQGTLHRDLKPSNVMIDAGLDGPRAKTPGVSQTPGVFADGRVRITDFGLALNVDSNSDLTKSGQALGTPAYMPPEQAQGKRGLIGPASDVYSLGAILFELLTGRPPFRGETPVETIRLVIDTEPLSPRLLNPAVPRDLETICLKCLQKEPHRRYATAQFLADDLRRFLEGKPILARPIGRVARLWRWCKRKPLPAALSAALTLAVVTAVVVLAAANLLVGEALRDKTDALARARGEQRAAEQASRERGIALAAKVRALADRDAANAKLREALDRVRWQAYVRSISLAQRECEAGNLAAARELLDTSGPERFRGFEWHFLRDLCRDRLRHEWTGRVVRARRPFTTTGLMVAPVDGELQIYDGIRGRVIERFRLSRFQVVQAVSPDGRYVAATHHRGLHREIGILRVPGGGLQRTIRLETSAFIRDVAFSAEGKQIAAVVDYPIFSPRPHVRKIVGRRAAFVVWDVATGGEVRSLQPPGLKPATRPLERPRFSVGDDLRLLITSTGLIDTVTAKTVIAFEQPAVAHAFNRDATLAAVGTAAGQVTVWDVASGRKRDTWFVPAAGIRTLAFRPDGRAVAAACSDGSIRIRGVAALDGSAATHPSKVADGRSEIPLRTDSTVSDLAFTPDGGHLMTAHAPRGGLAAFRVWEAERRPALVLREVETPLGLGGPAAAISPDGRLVAAIGADHSVVLSNAITGDVVRRLPGTKRRAAVAFSRDGTLVAACGRDGFFVWSTGSGRLLRNFRPSGASLCTAPAFSPDGRHFAGSHAGGVTVWDLRTGSLVRRFRSGRHYCNSVAFSSDGTFLCATSDRGGCIWNVPQWTERCRLPDAHSTRGVLSPDDAIFATVGAGGIALTDTRTGKRTRLIPLRESSRVVAFSPDGKRLATTAGSRLLILDVKTGERVMTLSGHRGGINSVVFSRDGRRIVSAAADGTARIWGEPPLVSRLQAAGCGLIGVGLHIEPPEGGTPAGEARPPVVAPRPRRESRSAGR